MSGCIAKTYFRYLGSHWLDTLRDRRLKLAMPSELNDPFDCTMAYIGNPSRAVAKAEADKMIDTEFADICNNIMPRKERRVELQNKKRQVRKLIQEKFEKITNAESMEKTALDRTVRLLCMSSPDYPDNMDVPFEHSEILMWAHYANNHKGVRIELNFEKLNFEKSKIDFVQYSERRPTHDWSDGLEFHQKMLLDALMTKSKAWDYENEVRFFTHPKYCESELLENGQSLSFLPFPEDLIRRVDFGLNMTIEEQDECKKLLANDYPHVAIYKANYHPTEYRLRYEQIN